MRIGLDIDGVLYPFTDATNAALVQRFGIPDPGPWTSWGYLKETITREQYAWVWSNEGSDACFGQIHRTYPGVVEAVNALTRAGHKVHFVTHRDPRRCAVHTAMFLERHFSRHPWTGVHVIQAGTPKRSLARWDVFVDDKPETILDFRSNTHTKTFTPRRPWNVAELGDIDGWSIQLYDDPADIVAWVEARA